MEAGPIVVTLDKYYRQKENFESLSIDQAQNLFNTAIGYTIQVANLNWGGFVLNVKDNSMILAAATDDAQDD